MNYRIQGCLDIMPLREMSHDHFDNGEETVVVYSRFIYFIHSSSLIFVLTTAIQESLIIFEIDAFFYAGCAI